MALVNFQQFLSNELTLAPLLKSVIKLLSVILTEVLDIVLVHILIHSDVIGALCIPLQQDMPPERIIILHLNQAGFLMLFLFS